MKHTFEQGCLSVFPENRLTSSESDAFLDEMNALIDSYECKSVVIDLSDIAYVTSPVLHALLLLKRRIFDITLKNIQPAVMDMLKLAGMNRLFQTTDGFRKVSVDGCKVIGRGVKGTVYQYSPDTVIKVFESSEQLHNILKERELACCALVHGLPTAISFDVVRVGERYGAMFELINAESMSTELKTCPEKKEGYARIFAHLLLDVHHTEVNTDFSVPDIKPLVFRWIEMAGSVLEKDETARLTETVESVPDTGTMIHGDYHTNNIMMQRGEPFMIDMGTLSHGHPVFELANVYTAYVGFGKYDTSMVENFLGLPYDFCLSFWDIFFSVYTENMPAPEKERLLTLTRLLGNVRYMHHMLRRNTSSQETKRIISCLHGEISGLLKLTGTF